MFKDALGPYGINNRNQRKTSYIYQSQITLKSRHLTFNNLTTLHIGNSITINLCILETTYKVPFFKQDTDYMTANHGTRSDHSAIKVIFELIYIKLHTNKTDIIVIDWRQIQENKEVKGAFNERLNYSIMTNKLSDYKPTTIIKDSNFNYLIL